MRVPLSTSWKFGALVCALACASCTREVKTTSAAAWPPPPNQTPQSKPVRQVNNAIDAGEGDPQGRRLRERLAADANDLDARLSLARLYARQGHPDLALEHYRFAAERFPDSVPVTLALAKTLREMGQSGQAMETVRQGISKHPEGNWELLSLEGILNDEQGDHGEAEIAFRKAAALEPARAAVHNNLGYNLLLQEKFPEAATEFRKATQIDPHSAIAHNNLAAAFAAQSRSAEALAEWQRSGDPAVAHNNLAAVFIQQGRYPEARAELEEALRLHRNFPAALANLKLVAAKDGQPVPALAPKTTAKAQKQAVPETASSDAGRAEQSQGTAGGK